MEERDVSGLIIPETSADTTRTTTGEEFGEERLLACSQISREFTPPALLFRRPARATRISRPRALCLLDRRHCISSSSKTESLRRYRERDSDSGEEDR